MKCFFEKKLEAQIQKGVAPNILFKFKENFYRDRANDYHWAASEGKFSMEESQSMANWLKNRLRSVLRSYHRQIKRKGGGKQQQSQQARPSPPPGFEPISPATTPPYFQSPMRRQQAGPIIISSGQPAESTYYCNPVTTQWINPAVLPQDHTIPPQWQLYTGEQPSPQLQQPSPPVYAQRLPSVTYVPYGNTFSVTTQAQPSTSQGPVALYYEVDEVETSRNCMGYQPYGF